MMPQSHILSMPGQQTAGSTLVTRNPHHPAQACPPLLPRRPLHLWARCASTGVTEESLADIQKKNDLVHLVVGLVLSVGCSGGHQCETQRSTAMCSLPQIQWCISFPDVFISSFPILLLSVPRPTSLAVCHCCKVFTAGCFFVPSAWSNALLKNLPTGRNYPHSYLL